MMNVFYDDFIKKLYIFLLRYNTRFLVIKGTGASGKTTLSGRIKELYESNNLKVSIISMDDFITNTEVRKNSTKKFYNSDGVSFFDKYTSSSKESYCFNYYDTLMYNLDNGISMYYKKKHGEYSYLDCKCDLFRK